MITQQTSHLTTILEKGEPVSLTFHHLSDKNLKFLTSLLTKILSRSDKIYLQNTIITILREMIVNAVKANTKRVFFKKQNLDIFNHDDYAIGMEAFKEFLIKEKDIVEEDLRENELKVVFGLKKLEEGLKVIIQNNSEILPEEMEKIQSRIELARKYNDFSEVYMDVYDDMEGEGLGILLTMLFLRNSGIGENSFKIVSNKGITQSSFVIPSILKPREITNEIQQEIVKEVDQLPTFPEYIHELMRLCRDPESSINVIAEKILYDPSLTAAVLKLANSAGFITGKRIEHIDEAVMVIGLKNLNHILIGASAQKILEERYTSFKKIWEHSNRVARHARVIARMIKKKGIMENSFVSGLLHDLGKIVLISSNAKLSERIAEVAVKRKIRTSAVIEEVAIGISHAAIGELIAKKWNLPDYLVESIKQHHSPLNCHQGHRDVVYITYLANMLTGIDDGKYDYYSVEDEVLEHMGIHNEGELRAFHERVSEEVRLMDVS